jgi:hypothetical protein
LKIQLTAREINERGLWDKFCEMRGINPWAMSEGLISSDEIFIFDEDELRILGYENF